MIPYISVCLLFLFSFFRQPEVVTIYLIGDSTVADYTLEDDYAGKRYPIAGWGQEFPSLWNGYRPGTVGFIRADSVVIDDRARGGRSTRTFFQEGRWRAVYGSLKPGDVVMIQFGHNDAAVDKTERYVDIEGYKEFLRLYVSQTRQKGATPVLLTPVARNYPWEDGHLTNVHGDYPAAVRDVAVEMDVAFIDLNQLSMDFFSAKGREYVSSRYFMNLEAGRYPAYPDGQQDNTHFQPEGARAVAVLVFDAMKKLPAAGMGDHTRGPDTSGITGGRDSNFTRHGEWLRMRKQYPDIELVTEPKASPRIRREVVYREVDGLSLTGDIYHTATSGEKVPGILVVHGGGWRSGDKAQLGGLAYHLASAGYTCFAINYRLSTQALYPAGVHDVEAALQWMKVNADTLGIDPGEIAVLGFSAGGQLAALVGARKGNDEVAAIVDIDGILAFIHPESGEGDDTRSISAATYWFGYSKEERPDLWQEASALTYVSSMTPPTLFVNSSVDRMHAGRDDFIRVLDRFGIYHKTEVFADAPHSFCLFEPWFTPTSVAITGFLDRVFRAPAATSRTGG